MTRKEFLVVAIATLITVIGWVIFEILHARAQVKVSSSVQEVIQPIQPTFDLEGI